MLACIDFETTGLPLHPSAKPELQPRATELCIITIDDQNVQRTAFDELFNPGIPIPKKITEITGIDDNTVKDAQPFAVHIPAIQAVFDQCDCLIAHNLPFDGFILAHELRLAGVTDFRWPPNLMCTVQEFQPQFGYRPKLKQLCETILGRVYKQTHRAYDDCLILTQIIQAERYYDFPFTENPKRAFIPPEFRTDQSAEGLLHPE